MEKLFSLRTIEEFEGFCLKTFRNQYEHTRIYQEYVDAIQVDPGLVSSVSDIPFLPISFFKSHEVITEGLAPEIVFRSSGTSGSETSRHLVADLKLYRQSYSLGFQHFYGNPENYCFLALLPSYLEREGSSLILMMEDLIARSQYSQSGFYLNEYETLARLLVHNQNNRIPTVLLGVSYALLDLAEQYPIPIPDVIIMETGGMKGRRAEMSKTTMHRVLCSAFQTETIHSEYGMTELLSQAYSKGRGKFQTPPWMRILIRDSYDPFALVSIGSTGGINVIDLANQKSCSFIQTDDLGRQNEDGSFEILGRMSASQIRGCNLLLD